MFYPTVFDKGDNLTHVVKDRNTCNCGFKYNVFPTFVRSDFKKIKFKPANTITCPRCKALGIKKFS